MASDAKSPTPPATSAPSANVVQREKGVRIFSYPKVIFLFPTLVVALICGLGMLFVRDRTDPTKPSPAISAAADDGGQGLAEKYDRFKSPQNLFGVLFLGVLGFNLLVMALDFPRFTIVAAVVGVLFAVFFVLWIGAYFDFDLLGLARGIFGHVYVHANAGFYFMIAFTLTVLYGIVYVTRFLDYWEILPNEILHHHGPLSDLERFPTINLKFDKEIPDVLEYLFLGSGRIVMHVPGEARAIVLDNVLFINALEKALKGMMSRMEVQVTTDKDVVS